MPLIQTAWICIILSRFLAGNKDFSSVSDYGKMCLPKSGVSIQINNWKMKLSSVWRGYRLFCLIHCKYRCQSWDLSLGMLLCSFEPLLWSEVWTLWQKPQTIQAERLKPLALSCSHLHRFGHWYGHYLRNDVPGVKAGECVWVSVCVHMPSARCTGPVVFRHCSQPTDSHRLHSPSEPCHMNLPLEPCLTLTKHSPFSPSPAKLTEK